MIPVPSPYSLFLLQDEWVQLCQDTDALLSKARAQPFLFQQLEVVQAIQSSKKIASMHAFEVRCHLISAVLNLPDYA